MALRSELAREISDRVRQLRETKGWSQSRLAREAVLPEKTIQRIENGSHLPTPETVTALAAALGAREMWLYTGSGTRV